MFGRAPTCVLSDRLGGALAAPCHLLQIDYNVGMPRPQSIPQRSVLDAENIMFFATIPMAFLEDLWRPKTTMQMTDHLRDLFF